MTANPILLALAPIFFVILAGYGAGRLRIVENHHVDGLNALVMIFALPASLFVATASAPRKEMLDQAPLFLILALVMLLVQLAWYFFVRASSDVSKADAALQALTISFPNLAGVGLPIAAAVVGPDGVVPVAVALAAGSIIISPLSLVLVELDTGNPKEELATGSPGKVWTAFLRSVTKPVVLAPTVGILYSLAGWELLSLAKASLMLVGVAAPGVALFLTGLILSSQPFRLNWSVVAATGLADIGRPILTAVVVFTLPISTETAKIAILLSAIPSGFFGILFAVNYRLNSASTGSMVIASTLFSIVTLATVIALLF
ncbi:malonate transporter [Phyllobacterium trifolii]|uniref:Malonate transporter n=1 Tax=Phyllobacterium trifolii TaxID=300193 RepID=A0A839UAZ6_9HYPH|nr:AEC family transporter [Phyllobacterium trifolii]MBB3148118.1 malonate transporter [Phyllobacterium trifolii]